MEQKTATSEGCPFTCPYYKGPMPPYAEDMCPRTLDLLSRGIIVKFDEWWNEDDCRQVAGAINKVLDAWHEPIEGMGWHDVRPG